MILVESRLACKVLRRREGEEYRTLLDDTRASVFSENKTAVEEEEELARTEKRKTKKTEVYSHDQRIHPPSYTLTTWEADTKNVSSQVERCTMIILTFVITALCSSYNRKKWVDLCCTYLLTTRVIYFLCFRGLE